MKSGLLWYDKNVSNNLFDAVDRAAARYQEKFGISPNTAFANRAQLAEYASAHRAEFPKTKLSLHPKETILRDHIWIGVDETAVPRVAVISGAETDGSDVGPAPLPEPTTTDLQEMSAYFANRETPIGDALGGE